MFQIELKFEVLVFMGRGKPEYPEKNLSEQGRKPITNSTHIWRGRQDSNPGHIGGRQVLYAMRDPCSPQNTVGTLRYDDGDDNGNATKARCREGRTEEVLKRRRNFLSLSELELYGS